MYDLYQDKYIIQWIANLYRIVDFENSKLKLIIFYYYIIHTYEKEVTVIVRKNNNTFKQLKEQLFTFISS